MDKKIARRAKIKAVIRTKVSGTAEQPRLTVFRSNCQIYAQVIDDVKGVTLASASSLNIKDKMTKTEKAKKVGTAIAEAAKAAGVEQVVFDRNGYLYHGRVQTLADAAREAGRAKCNCYKKDPASVEACIRSILSESYAAYQNNTEFKSTMEAEFNGCVKEKATAAAKEAGDKAIKAGAEALSKKFGNK